MAIKKINTRNAKKATLLIDENELNHFGKSPKFDHALKCNPEIFKRIIDGQKTAEIRFNDRGFQTGDIIKFEAYDKIKKEYLNEMCWCKVTHIFTPPTTSFDPYDYGIKEGYVMLSIKLI